MNSTENENSAAKFIGRIRKSWLPLAAVGGALASFLAAAFKTRPEPGEYTEASGTAEDSASTGPAALAAPPPGGLKLTYTQTLSLGGKGSPNRFKHSLVDIALDSEDNIYGLGDDEIRIFSPAGKFLRSWKVKPQTTCLEAGPDGRIYTGMPGRVEIYSQQGQYSGGLDIGYPDKPAGVTAIKFLDEEMLVADAAARIIHRYNSAGKRIGAIGDQNKTGSFMLPNGWLDFDIAPDGILYATDTGRHRVTGWLQDGSPKGFFGKFGMRDASNFVGCCNPVNLAVTPDGNIVTAEKMIARVKVFDPTGVLLAYIGPENFNQKSRNIHLAVDSNGRILAADPLYREIKIFTPSAGI